MPTPKHLPDANPGREVIISIIRDGVETGAIRVRCSIGTAVISDSTVYGYGRDALARSIVDAFLNGDFDESVPR